VTPECAIQPAQITKVLLPMDRIWASTFSVAPDPIASIAMTAAAPAPTAAADSRLRTL
jgi:hypothetical protein